MIRAQQQVRAAVRELRQAIALAVAPWLVVPEPPDALDLRGRDRVMTESAAQAIAAAWACQMEFRGRPVARQVTIFYTGVDTKLNGDGYYVTSILREAA